MTRLLPLLLCAISILPGGRAARPSAQLLSVSAVAIDPDEPTTDSLCTLSVTIRNDGEQSASRFRFAVFVNDVALPAYEVREFHTAVAAGEERSLVLLNFWATEESRPPPEDGTLTVRVELTQASWVRIAVDEDGVEEQILAGAVSGLPSRTHVTALFRRPAESDTP